MSFSLESGAVRRPIRRLIGLDELFLPARRKPRTRSAQFTPSSEHLHNLFARSFERDFSELIEPVCVSRSSTR
jgi:hypothetical protein